MKYTLLALGLILGACAISAMDGEPEPSSESLILTTPIVVGIQNNEGEQNGLGLNEQLRQSESWRPRTARRPRTAQPGIIDEESSWKSRLSSLAANAGHIAAPVAVAYCTHHLAPVIGKLAGRYVPRACSNSWVGMCAKTALIFGSSYASAKLANKSEEYFANERFFAQYAKPVNLFTFAALASSRKARYALGAWGLALTAYAFMFNRGIQYFYRDGYDPSPSTKPKVKLPQAPLQSIRPCPNGKHGHLMPQCISSERQHVLLEHVAQEEGIYDGAQIKRLVEQFCSDVYLQGLLKWTYASSADDIVKAAMVKAIMRGFVQGMREELQRSAVPVPGEFGDGLSDRPAVDLSTTVSLPQKSVGQLQQSESLSLN